MERASYRFSGHDGKKRAGPGTRPCSPEFAGRSAKKGRGRQSAGRHFPSFFGLWLRAGAFQGWVRLPYLGLSKRIEGIDDPRSRYYNKLVDRSKVAKIDWRSSEQMRRDDVRYKWGVVVDHNQAAIPGAGSCIFLHVWQSPSTATAGCTAMRESDLLAQLHWLDPAHHPVLVQMPRAAYRSIQRKYGLPPDHL